MDVSSYNLLDDFRISGHWWLPTDPEDRVSGTLTVNPDLGVRLELTGVFSSMVTDVAGFWSDPRSFRLDLMLGSDADGQVYTLHKLDMLQVSATSTFRVSYLLAGRHFFSVAEIIFCSALIQYSYLEAWSCFQFTRPGKSASPEFYSLEVPTSVVTLFKTNEAGPIKELSLHAYASQRFAVGVVEIKPRAQFHVTLNVAADLRTVSSVADDLGQLLTMLIGEPSYVKKLRLHDRAGTAVDVFLPSTIRIEKALHPLETCFPLRDIHDLVQSLAEKWFSSLPLLEPTYDLLFGTLFGRDAFVRTKFLNLAQALESFHRRTIGGTYTSSDEFSKVRDALTAAVPGNTPVTLRQKVSDAIKYANEYSLRKRLKELLGTFGRRTIEALKISDIPGTADLIVKTRNYLTHFDEDSRTNLIDDIVAMHYMNERLTAILFILVLKHLGMDETQATAGTLKHRYFQ